MLSIWLPRQSAQRVLPWKLDPGLLLLDQPEKWQYIEAANAQMHNALPQHVLNIIEEKP